MATHLWAAATKGAEVTFISKYASHATKQFRNAFQNLFQKSGKQLLASKTETICQINRVQRSKQVDVVSLSHDIVTKFFPQTSLQTLASNWRLSAAKKLLSSGFGKTKNVSVFAFVGLCYGFHAESRLTINHEFVCTEIRNLFDDIHFADNSKTHVGTDVKVQNFQFGNFIAKGSCSAVYEAKLVTDVSSDNTSEGLLSEVGDSMDSLTDSLTGELPETSLHSAASITQLEDSLSSESDAFVAVDESEVSSEDDDISVVGDESEYETVSPNASSLNSNLGIMLAESVIDKFLTDHEEDQQRNNTGMQFSEEVQDGSLNTRNDFDLAVKMMFNYYAESSAEAVTMAMEKEMVPMKLTPPAPSLFDRWKFRMKKKTSSIPPHPNIVDMRGVFVDQVADFPDKFTHYPAALPQRLNPNGLGRNMTMFLVMKRYTTTLREYLKSEALDVFTRCLLISQILEGVTFLRNSGVAHRDLKSDNILVDITDQNDPLLVITDFGCCLYDNQSLEVPYNTIEIPKGGNSALLAPEIACTKPGWLSTLDYRKSDLWTVGTLVYEIFGEENPFYKLDTVGYTEKDLPNLPDNCPGIVRKLVSCLLQREPHKRLEPAIAANVMQLLLWGPSHWSVVKPSRKEVFDWLLSFCRQVTCEDICTQMTNSEASVEHILRQTFLSRVRFSELVEAVNFLRA